MDGKKQNRNDMKNYKTIAFLVIFIYTSLILSAQINNGIHYSEIDCEDRNDSIKCADKLLKTLRVIDIDKENTIYIIHTNDSLGRTYTVFSPKDKVKGSKRIEIDEKYEFYLVPYLDLDCVQNYENEDFVLVGGNAVFYIKVANRIVRISLDGNNNFYGTPNLKGLSYIPYDGTEEDKTYPYFRSHSNWLRRSELK